MDHLEILQISNGVLMSVVQIYYLAYLKTLKVLPFTLLANTLKGIILTLVTRVALALSDIKQKITTLFIMVMEDLLLNRQLLTKVIGLVQLFVLLFMMEQLLNLSQNQGLVPIDRMLITLNTSAT